MLQGPALLYTVTLLTAMGFMLIGYDNVSYLRGSGEYELIR